MRRALLVAAYMATLIGAFAGWWRRHPRFGAATMNRLVNPWLVRQGIAEVTAGEIGLLEHVGRMTGKARVTPVHPADTPGGVRIIVPLGSESQWARNVMAAGHCRLQIGDMVQELDEPRLVEPTAVAEVPAGAARVMAWLGFRYLHLRRIAERPGTLGTPSRNGVELGQRAVTNEAEAVAAASSPRVWLAHAHAPGVVGSGA
jgi:deazaflavin-dependent oxidoreductase (nitroreductase family)